MTGRPLVVLVGHPRAASRTHRVATRVGQLLARELRADRVEVDLAQLGPHLLDPGGARATEAAVTTVQNAAVLVVASPTFRAAYSGLVKLFLDLVPRHGLAGTLAVPVMTAGLAEHRWVADRLLRPVLQELRATVPARGLTVLESQLSTVDQVFAAWWATEGPAVLDAWTGGEDAEWGRTLANRTGGALPA